VRCCLELPDRGECCPGGKLAAWQSMRALPAPPGILDPAVSQKVICQLRHRPPTAAVYTWSSLAPLRPCEGVMYLHEAQLLLRIEAATEAERRYPQLSLPRRGWRIRQRSRPTPPESDLHAKAQSSRRPEVQSRSAMEWLPVAQAGRGHSDGGN
jgi:hypothetical protein